MARAIVIGIILGFLIFAAVISIKEVMAQERPKHVPPATAMMQAKFLCHSKEVFEGFKAVNNMTPKFRWQAMSTGLIWEFFKNPNDMWWLVFYHGEDVCAASVKVGGKII